MLAMFTLIACKKEPVVYQNAPKTVEIKILNGVSATKAVTAPAEDGQFVCSASDLTALFADAAGNVVSHEVFPATAEGNGTYRFEDVDASVSQVAVIALQGNSAPGTIAAAEELWAETEQVDAEAGKLIAYGLDAEPEASGNAKDGYLLSAELSVVPAHARIEIASISCTDFGSFSSITLGQLSLADGAYAQSVYATLDRNNTTAVAGTDVVWSWNILEQAVSPMVLDLTVASDSYVVAVPERTVTIASYKVDGTAISTFEKGKVYSLNISFTESNIDETAADISVDVTVSIAQWVVKETDYEFATK